MERWKGLRSSGVALDDILLLRLSELRVRWGGRKGEGVAGSQGGWLVEGVAGPLGGRLTGRFGGMNGVAGDLWLEDGPELTGGTGVTGNVVEPSGFECEDGSDLAGSAGVTRIVEEPSGFEFCSVLSAPATTIHLIVQNFL